MKKIFLLIFLAITMGTAVAQIGFAPEIGIGLAGRQIIPPGSFDIKGSYILAGKVGGVVDIDLDDHFYLQSGLAFSTKGDNDVATLSSDSEQVRITESIRINYLEAPLMVIYKTKLQGNSRVVFGLGAYFGYAVSASYKFHSGGREYIHNVLQSFDTGSSYKLTPGTDIKIFDMGVCITAGYELPAGLFVRASGSIGISNTSVYLGESDKNRSFVLSAGYYFGKGRRKRSTEEPLIIK